MILLLQSRAAGDRQPIGSLELLWFVLGQEWVVYGRRLYLLVRDVVVTFPKTRWVQLAALDGAN